MNEKEIWLEIIKLYTFNAPKYWLFIIIISSTTILYCFIHLFIYLFLKRFLYFQIPYHIPHFMDLNITVRCVDEANTSVKNSPLTVSSTFLLLNSATKRQNVSTASHT